MSKTLIKELHALVSAGVIDEAAVEKIKAYYQSRESTTPNTLTVVLGVLGSLLVGSGILLVIAHNWDEFSGFTKTILAFMPLVAAQAIGIYTLLRKREVRVWNESAAILLFIANGAAMALISQIYQVSGSLSGFIFLWTVLGLPLIYLFSSSALTLLLLGIITWYAALVGYRGYEPQYPFEYFVGLLCIVPHYIKLYRGNADANFVHFIHWAFAISLTIVAGSFTHIPHSWYEWLPLLYCTLFCLFICMGRLAFLRQQSLWKNPFLLLGLPAMLAMLFIWSFGIHGDRPWFDESIDEISTDPLPYLLITMTGLIVYFIARQFKTLATRPYPEVFSFIALFVSLFALNNFATAAQLLLNIWILLLACFYIAKGAREDNLPVMNFGLVILGILALCRFFDSDIPFLWRSLFFVTAGAGFFIANLLVIRKRKQLKSRSK